MDGTTVYRHWHHGFVDLFFALLSPHDMMSDLTFLPSAPEGPLFVAWSLQLFLAGICVTAFYYYVRDGHLSRDSTHVKIVAVSVLGLNTAIGLFCGVLIFQSGVSQNRSTDQLWSSSVLLCLQPTFAAMVGFLVQGWFARRGSLVSLFFFGSYGAEQGEGANLPSVG